MSDLLGIEASTVDCALETGPLHRTMCRSGKNAVVNDPEPSVRKGEGGYADWAIVALHGLREYLNQPYRRLMDILQKMPAVVDITGLSTDELPDFTMCVSGSRT